MSPAKLINVPMAHMIRASPGLPQFVKIVPGVEKIPVPTHLETTQKKALTIPTFLL